MNEKMEVKAQAELLTPLIAEERAAFNKAEGARLASCMGRKYWDGSEICVFHPLPEGADETVLPDPNELSLAELAVLPVLQKRIERNGTLSYTALFRCFPEDRVRLALWGELNEKIECGQLCPTEKVSSLLRGHSEYMSFKAGYEVKVIM